MPTSTPLVLVADDEPSMLELVARHLRTMNAPKLEVIQASDGEEAWRLAREHLPDLAVLDVMMPGMSGYEVCAAIRADPAQAMLPIVLVTALDPAKERAKGLDAGADDFLTKPVSQADLLARVRSLLRIKSLYDAVLRQQLHPA